MKKNVLEALKNRIKESASEGSEIHSKIAALKWKPGRPLVQRDESGRKISGKKAWKAFRRPETGYERHCLWSDKRSVKQDARWNQVVYGMLRGRAYRSLEPKTRPGNELHPRWLLGTLNHAAGDVPHGITEAEIKAWLEGGPSPTYKGPSEVEKVPQKVEASVSVPAPQPSLLERLKAKLELWGLRWQQSCT